MDKRRRGEARESWINRSEPLKLAHHGGRGEDAAKDVSQQLLLLQGTQIQDNRCVRDYDPLGKSVLSVAMSWSNISSV